MVHAPRLSIVEPAGWFIAAAVVASTSFAYIGHPSIDGGYRAIHFALMLAAVLVGLWVRRPPRPSLGAWLLALLWLLVAAVALVHPVAITLAVTGVGVAGAFALARAARGVR
jgi:FtsH-binding integral membrane protein